MGKRKPAKPMASVKTLLEYAKLGIRGRTWYPNATAQIDYVAKRAGWSTDEFCGVLATTSPRCSVLRNIRMSLHFMNFRNDRVVPMKGIRKSLNDFLDGKGIHGPKTHAFYHNLAGRNDYVTLDVWMAYALGVKQADFSLKETHRVATERVVRVGEILRISPAAAQACVWTGYRELQGRTDSPFDVIGEYLTAVSNDWVVEGCHTNRK